MGDTMRISISMNKAFKEAEKKIGGKRKEER